MKHEFQQLFSPLQIGQLEIPNRMVMSPMASHFASSEGKVTDPLIAWYEERAKGGVGLIISESNFVRIDGRSGFDRLGLYDDSCIPGHKKLVDTIHQYGTRICAQLHHSGRLAPAEVIGSYPIGPSTTHNYVKGNVPWVGTVCRQLTINEIRELVEAFGQAARRAKQAGFDAIEIHGAHGYLINQFLSPRTNLRTDQYGGSVERNTRFLREVIERVKVEVGDDMPILLRLSAEEKVPGGYTIDYTLKAIEHIIELIDAIDISAGAPDSIEWMNPPKSVERGYNSVLSKRVKEQFDIPVGVVGRIKTPDDAEQLINDQKADFVVLGRALISDPYFPLKAKEGRAVEIRECIACTRCYDEVERHGQMLCAVNPFAGRESTLKLLPLKHKKKILVIGGGVAGMQAAVTAKERGHEVVLYEKEAELGGQALLASKNPHDPEIGSVVQNLITDLERLHVPIHLQTAVDRDLILQLQPDEIILATGASPKKMSIEGADKAHVRTVAQILKGDVPDGQRAVVLGGGLSGACVSEFLYERGIEVAMMKRSVNISDKAGFTIQKEHTHSLNELGIPIYVGCDIVRIEDEAVIYTQFDQEKRMETDIVVIAMGMLANNRQLEEIEKLQFPVTAVGDCVKPREILEAIHEGFTAANNIGN